jgi:hypothetical protein
MKKRLIVSAAFFAFAAGLTAHPASDILFSANVKAGEVKLEVMHQVKDKADHYIYEIELKVNGKKAIRQDAGTQTSDKSQSVTYVIPGLKAGDKVEVYADCNKTGDLRKEFTVAETPAPVKDKKAKK